MDKVDRSRRAAISAIRDAAGRARALAEGLEALMRELDALVVELPQAVSSNARGREPPDRDGEPWTKAEVRAT